MQSSCLCMNVYVYIYVLTYTHKYIYCYNIEFSLVNLIKEKIRGQC